MPKERLQLGIEELRQLDFAPLRGKRVGLLTNPSAVDQNLVSTYDIFRNSKTVNLTALFSPEHGIAAAVADGVHVNSSIDPLTGLPVHSLYGSTQKPTPDMLADVDVIVCDIQDIGVRYYTFAWTVSYILEAAGENGIEVVILDRPNPLGQVVFGSPLDPTLSSLVGRFSIPTQHGMTLGELAQLFNARWNPTPAKLSVISCANYHRTSIWEDLRLPFVPPSPNMPHLSTVRQYPGACLIEGTSLSEGRGTALPFEIVGAPDLNGVALADALNSQNWDGVRFRPHTFIPTASKHIGVACGGVQVHITDLESFQPLQIWLGILSIIYQHQPFSWENHHFDRLIGSSTIRGMIEMGTSFDSIFADWASFRAEFEQIRKPYLLYGD